MCRLGQRLLQPPKCCRRKWLSVVSISLVVTVVVSAPFLWRQEFRWMTTSLHQLDLVPRYVKTSSSSLNRNDSVETILFLASEASEPAATESNTTLIVVSKTTTVTTAKSNIPQSNVALKVTRSNALSLLNDLPKKPNPFPPLSTLIGDRMANVTGNVQFLLDFAIIGNFKCGTTTFLQWMKDHNETLVIPYESYSLHRGRPAALVHRLYRLQPPSTTKRNSSRAAGPLSVSAHNTSNIMLQRGYKCPIDIQRRNTLQLIQKHFSQTRLIVGIRHPILWFESFYNFRIQNSFPPPTTVNHTNSSNTSSFMPHPNKLIGPCRRNMYHVCTDASLFHVHLARMGKTEMTNDERQDFPSRYLNMTLEDGDRRPERMSNPVFLYEVTQLQTPRGNSSRVQDLQQRSNQFRRDVQTFLGFQHELPPIPHALPGKTWDDKPQDKALRNAQKIRICDDEYLPVRSHLLKQSQEASLWIRKYFLKAPDVFVSSRDHFESILETWMYDPCANHTTTLQL